MLKSLSLHNFALFKKQEINFGDNMNVILGETGAGKSLIFDALNFVLAYKTDKTLLRFGENMMRVDAVFEPISDSAKLVLKDAEIDDEENELVLTRTLYADGKSNLRINGVVCPQTIIKKLAPELVDTFLQHESLQILKAKNHLSLLDKFCDFYDLKEKLSQTIDLRKEKEKKLNSLGGSDEMRLQRKDILEYQINELESAQLKLGEDDELDERIKFLESSEKIVENISEVLSMLENGSASVISQINTSSRLISRLGDLEDLSKLSDRLESASIELDDIVSELKEILAQADSDPKELERLDARKDKLKSLKRKYGGSIDTCLKTLEKLKQELDDLCDSEDLTKKLLKEIEQLKIEENDLCEKINSIRKQQAEKIKKRLEEELVDLGMKSTRFEIVFERKPVSYDGFDEVLFVFSANKGQELKDLAKTASGGESSRIMLAMKNMFAKEGDFKTMLFDEIDSGISGEVGNMMAQKLSSIARRDQVITITHLPQVASAGDNFFKVEKYVENEQTYSKVTKIEGEEVVKEIAQIIGGNDVTDVMLENARQLYLRGRKFGR